MTSSSSRKQELSSEQQNPSKPKGKSHLILHNDDVHSFDFVIDSLMAVCNHEHEQAEQCATIVHHRGQCVVKTDRKTKLIPLSEALRGLGLTVTIE